MSVVFHLDGVDHDVGGSWYRRETEDTLGEREVPLARQHLRVPMHLLPRMPWKGDTVTVMGVLRYVEGTDELGPAYLVKLRG